MNQASSTMQSIQSLSMQISRHQQHALAAADHHHHQGASSAARSPGLDTSAGAGAHSASQQQLADATSKLTRMVSKKASRVKEILLQNIGKAERTTDELFQVYEENFYKQQAQALKLHKVFKGYVGSLRGVHEASRTLGVAMLSASGDYQWARHDLICESVGQLEQLNEDLLEKLRGQVLASLGEYLTQFGELRTKIAKRHRKLIDYDSARRIYEAAFAQLQRRRQAQSAGERALVASANGSLSTGCLSEAPAPASALDSDKQRVSSLLMTAGSGAADLASTSQLVEEARVLKLREQFNFAKVMYETINSELHEELPLVYGKKMQHLLMALQNYFSLEAQFHSNAGKLYATAADVIDELPESSMQRAGAQFREARVQAQAPAPGKQQQPEGGVAGPLGGAAVVGHCGASSGMGSSRGDSSLESGASSSAESASVSPDGSRRSATPGDDEPGSPARAPDDEQEEEEAPEPELEPELEEASDAQEDMAPGEASHSKEDKLAEEDNSCEGNFRAEHEAPIGVPLAGVPHDQERPPETGAPADQPSNDQDQEAQKAAQAPLSHSDAGPSATVAATETVQAAEQPAAKPHDSCLYKVRTNYKYLAEDVDELCFEADELIQVIKFDEGQEPEEGWLMGVREVNGQRGLFPANFTRLL